MTNVSSLAHSSKSASVHFSMGRPLMWTTRSPGLNVARRCWRSGFERVDAAVLVDPDAEIADRRAQDRVPVGAFETHALATQIDCESEVSENPHANKRRTIPVMARPAHYRFVELV